MNIIEPGHIYELNEVKTNHEGGPTKIFDTATNIIRFVNNEGPDYYNGVQTQEVLRALIDRTMHCDNCLRWPDNDKIIFHLRMALVLHEARALERKVEKGKLLAESVATGFDGHFSLDAIDSSHISKDNKKYHTKIND